MSPEVRTVAQVNKKWFEIQAEAKKRILNQRGKNETGGGQTPGPTDVTPQEERLMAIIRNSDISDICECNQGGSDDFNPSFTDH